MMLSFAIIRKSAALLPQVYEYISITTNRKCSITYQNLQIRNLKLKLIFNTHSTSPSYLYCYYYYYYYFQFSSY